MTEPDKAKARNAALVLTKPIELMQAVIADDELYLHTLKLVEAWLLGQRTWIELVIRDKALPPAIEDKR